jgi:hypothetical protein
VQFYVDLSIDFLCFCTNIASRVRLRGSHRQRGPASHHVEHFTKFQNACSLTSRTLTVASQKVLFRHITLTDIVSKYCYSGTSSAFHKLLKSSPHIAKYVRVLSINEFEYDLSSDDTKDEPDIWLATDIFLPLISPLLCNLDSLVLYYDHDWALLDEGVRRSLHDLVRLPSLVYAEMLPCAAILLTESFGSNVKRLVIRSRDNSTCDFITPEPPRSSAIYLDTFFMREFDPSFLVHLIFDPDFRFKTSQLRKLVLDIQTDATFQNFALRSLLHSCRETLEDFILCMYCNDCGSTFIISSHPLSHYLQLQPMSLT